MKRLRDRGDVEIREFSCRRVCVPTMITKNSTNNVLRTNAYFLTKIFHEN